MKKAIVIVSILLIVAITGYVYWNYYNPYSEGYREGVLQKFSRKGDVFKTYEGEMIQLGFGQRIGGPISSQYFYFSVDDIILADSLEGCLGKNVKLHYIQYRRSLPWRGDVHKNDESKPRSQYVVDGLAEVKEASRY